MSKQEKVVKDGQLSDILDAINAVTDKNVYPVYVPTLDKTIMFREMNTRQEKMLVKTIVDSPIYNSEFIFAIRTIINENATEDIDVDALTIIDKIGICLSMRAKSIGEDYEFTFKDEGKTTTIHIPDYIKKFNAVTIPDDLEVESEGIKVLCGYPTIGVEYKLEKEFRDNVTPAEVTNIKEAREILGDVFTNEIVKYIKGITITTDSGEMVLDMDDYKFKDRLTILDKIGNKVLSKIMSYIEETNKEIQKVLEVEMKLNKTDAKKHGVDKLTSVLEAGSDFFIIS